MYAEVFGLKRHEVCSILPDDLANVCVGEMQWILQVLTTGECR